MFNNDENHDYTQSDFVWGNDLEQVPVMPEPTQPKKKANKILVISLVILFLSMALIGLAISTNILFGDGWLHNIVSENNNNIDINIPIQEKPKLPAQYYDEETGLYTPQGIAKKVLPSVVSIVIYEKTSMFDQISQGSGIIMTENGYIITNAHVVDYEDVSIRVILNNDKEYDAVLIGKDVKTDLAVVKINENDLPVADFGDSKQLEIGENIITLGSPAGLYGSLTSGVVSGLDRMIKTEEENIEMNCIQIDAAINPGNSGGALVNMYGQVVGINSSKYISELYDGIGFAISFDAAKPIIEELISDGYVKNRVRIGIVFNEVTQHHADELDIASGLWVKEIDESCDIAKSGLKIDDVITHIEGMPVVYKSNVTQAIKGKKPGDTVTAKISRKLENGEFETLEISFKLMEDKSMQIKQ